MPRITWLTDIHLNFVAPAEHERFFALVRQSEPDAILLSGDVGEAQTVVGYLEKLDDALQRPLYFVLGNHDFYFGSIREVRARIAELCRRRPRLVYLSQSEPVQIAPGVGLVGHDGWADARLGDYERSQVMLNDYKLVAELAGVSKAARRPLLHALGDEAAAHVRRVLLQALAEFREVFVVTHVPPLREACWHEGRHSDDEWAPHFACQAMGDAILDCARQFPDRRLTVLCGHTHGSGQTQPLDNLLILTGGAEYGRPAVSRVLDCSST